MVSEDVAPPLITGEFVAGSRVAGYRLEERIGRGGMAVVFRAHDERLNRQVALKILAPSLAADEAFRRRFIRESQAAAAVDDPNIIPVFEAGQAADVLFIAMRLVRGGDVRSLVGRNGPLPPWRAVWIVAAVASALDAAHAAGLVHRDVKPANMLLDVRPGRLDHVYLSDFGLSKGALGTSGLTGSGQFLGTVDYAAPEQLSGHAVSGRADQYSLGCAAFELLSGRPPFARDQGLAVVYAHLSEPPPRLSARRSGLPEGVDGVFLKVLAKDPADRYADCHEFAADLRRQLGVQAHAADSATGMLIAATGAAEDERANIAPTENGPTRAAPSAEPDLQATGAERPTRRRRRTRSTQAAETASSPEPAVAPGAQAGASPPASIPDRPATQPAALPDPQPAAPPIPQPAAEEVREPGETEKPGESDRPGGTRPAQPDSSQPDSSQRDLDTAALSRTAAPADLTSTLPSAHRQGRKLRRTILIGGLVALMIAGGVAAVLLTHQHPQAAKAATSRSYTFSPIRYPDGLVVMRHWTLSGPGGTTLREMLTVSNPTKSTVVTLLAEPVPPAAARLSALRFIPPPLRTAQADSLVYWKISVPAGKTVVLQYSATVPAAGIATTRMIRWANGVVASAATANNIRTTAQLRSLAIAPRVIRIRVGRALQLRLTGKLADGSGAPAAMLRQVSWRMANPAVASVSPSGKVEAKSPGTTTVTARVAAITASAKVTITGLAPNPGPTYQPPPSSGSPHPSGTPTVTGHSLIATQKPQAGAVRRSARDDQTMASLRVVLGDLDPCARWPCVTLPSSAVLLLLVLAL